jgi:glucosylglycerol-phosphate synthase
MIVQDTKKGRKLILSASRVDYTKGNEELLLAFERLLERREDLHGEVVLMLACVAAASGMKIYEETQRSIEEMAGRINGRFSQVDWIQCASPRGVFLTKRWWPGSAMQMSAGSHRFGMA